MSKRSARTSLSLFLAATVLAGGIFPPATRHGHEGGSDLSHRHDSRLQIQPERHDYIARMEHPGDVPSHRRAAVPEGGATADWSAHLHFVWLGFRLTLPDSGSSDKNGDVHNTKQLVFVRAGRDLTSSSHSGYGLDRALTLALQQALPDVAAISPAFRCSFQPVVTSLLCDRARHERSGVLLA
jgi:hypothetical protein